MEKLIGTKSELIKQILDLKFEDNDFLKAEITRIKDKTFLNPFFIKSPLYFCKLILPQIKKIVNIY